MVISLHKFVFVYFLFFVVIFSYANIDVSAQDDKYVIYLDPGHGGLDGGCNYKDLVEKNINLKIATKIKEGLIEKGYEVRMTRTGDIHLCKDKFSKKEDLQTRVDLINNSQADLFISIHTNSFVNPKYYGAQVFYNSYLDNNTFIGTQIQSYLSEYTQTTRIAKNLKNVMILREITKPGCLVECGFISNPMEYNLLQDEAYLAQLSNCIIYGIDDYFLTYA